MKLIRLCLLPILLVVLPCFAEKPNNFHAYYALGGNLSPSGSLRIGWKDWEVGKMSPPFFGAAKRFFIGNTVYSQLGFGVAGYGGGTYPAVHSSLGFDKKLIWLLGIRGEIWALVNTSGVARAEGLIGVSIQL